MNNCPNYYVKSLEDNSVVCTNKYTTPDNSMVYEISPSVDSLKQINLTTLGNSGKNTVEGICSMINDGKSDYKSKLSWTELKPLCD